jgi:hypothetical protein
MAATTSTISRQHHQSQQSRTTSTTTSSSSSNNNTTTSSSSSSASYTKFQFVVLGGANAGKSSILRRYFYNRFDHDRMPTVGADYYTTRIEYNNPTLSTLLEEKLDDNDNNNDDNNKYLNHQVHILWLWSQAQTVCVLRVDCTISKRDALDDNLFGRNYR